MKMIECLGDTELSQGEKKKRYDQPIQQKIDKHSKQLRPTSLFQLLRKQKLLQYNQRNPENGHQPTKDQHRANRKPLKKKNLLLLNRRMKQSPTSNIKTATTETKQLTRKQPPFI